MKTGTNVGSEPTYINRRVDTGPNKKLGKGPVNGKTIKKKETGPSVYVPTQIPSRRPLSSPLDFSARQVTSFSLY